jgi:hypothetical protein
LNPSSWACNFDVVNQLIMCAVCVRVCTYVCVFECVCRATASRLLLTCFHACCLTNCTRLVLLSLFNTALTWMTADLLAA